MGYGDIALIGAPLLPPVGGRKEGQSGSGGTFEQVAGANDDSEPEEQPECDHVCLPISERREDVALVSWP